VPSLFITLGLHLQAGRQAEVNKNGILLYTTHISLSSTLINSATLTFIMLQDSTAISDAYNSAIPTTASTVVACNSAAAADPESSGKF